jgi:predicted DNA-binding transcriptional regulator AlpA
MRSDATEDSPVRAASAPRGEPDVFITFDGLRARGIPYGRSQLYRLMKAGQFPASVRLSANRIAWRLSELQDWMDSRPRAREAAAA